MADAKIFTGSDQTETEFQHLIGQHCLVEPSGDADFATMFRARFEDGFTLLVDADELREYTIADHNADQSRFYAERGR